MIIAIIFCIVILLLSITYVGIVGTEKLTQMFLDRAFNDDLIEEEKNLREYIMENETFRLGTKMIMISYVWFCISCLIPLWIVLYVCENIKYVFVKRITHVDIEVKCENTFVCDECENFDECGDKD